MSVGFNLPITGSQVTNTVQTDVQNTVNTAVNQGTAYLQNQVGSTVGQYVGTATSTPAASAAGTAPKSTSQYDETAVGGYKFYLITVYTGDFWGTGVNLQEVNPITEGVTKFMCAAQIKGLLLVNRVFKSNLKTDPKLKLYVDIQEAKGGKVTYTYDQVTGQDNFFYISSKTGEIKPYWIQERKEKIASMNSIDPNLVLIFKAPNGEHDPIAAFPINAPKITASGTGTQAPYTPSYTQPDNDYSQPLGTIQQTGAGGTYTGSYTGGGDGDGDGDKDKKSSNVIWFVGGGVLLLGAAAVVIMSRKKSGRMSGRRPRRARRMIAW